MKQKDIALVMVIVFIGAIVSFFVSGALFGSPASRQQEAEIVQPISADFPKPDSRYFNSQSFDPTKVIQVTENANTEPFKETSQ